MALEGTFGDMSLKDLFEILEAGSRSGRLALTRDQDHCIMLLSQGQAAEALLLRGPQRQRIASDMDAILEACTWEEASFVFEHDPRVLHRPRRVHARLADLLARAQQQNLPGALPKTLNDVVLLAMPDGGDAAPISLSAAEWQLVCALCRKVSLATACDNASMAPTDVLLLAQRLAQRGLLERHGAQREEVARPTPPRLAPQPPPILAAAAPTPARGARAQATSGALLKAIIRRVQSL